VRLEFSINLPYNQDYDNNNKGAGWFVDNLTVSGQFVAEVCDDKADNDGNGKVDCADPACVGKPACVESQCVDAVDNDGDGATDCADSDCATALLCGKPVLQDSFACGTETKWSYTVRDNQAGIKWAVDNLASIHKPPPTTQPAQGESALRADRVLLAPG
jgi:hypothetical protein